MYTQTDKLGVETSNTGTHTHTPTHTHKHKLMTLPSESVEVQHLAQGWFGMWTARVRDQTIKASATAGKLVQ